MAAATEFFLPGDDVEQGYRNVRDAREGPAVRGRAFVEELWAHYRGLEDRHFLQDARRHFQERFWEMYLAVTLVERGLPPTRQSAAGPEFSCLYGECRVWMEAVTPGPGVGENEVQGSRMLEATDIPVEKILLRFTSAVVDKRRRYLAARESELIKESDGYVLAINSGRIPHAPFGSTMPYYLQALLPIGNRTLVINRQSRAVVDSYYAYRDRIEKATGVAVSTAPLLDPQYAFLSAVIHSAADCVNRPEELGADFTVLHNPLAARPLDMAMFGWCTQYVFKDWELREIAPSGPTSGLSAS